MAEMGRRLRKITEPMLQEEMEDIILSNPKPLKSEKEIEFTKGENPDKTKIGRYRNNAYAREKNIQNPIAGFGNVDLIKTGRFVKQLFPYKTSATGYLFANKLDYGRDLITRYGRDILGINHDAFFKIQVNIYRPELVRFIRKQIGQ